MNAGAIPKFIGAWRSVLKDSAMPQGKVRTSFRRPSVTPLRVEIQTYSHVEGVVQ